MSDRTDPAARPNQDGPWPPVTDTSRIYDHGQPWCAHAEAHPDRHGGYSDPHDHPAAECRGLKHHLEDARERLEGAPVNVTAYLAALSRFGQPRDARPPGSAQVVIEQQRADGADPVRRMSVTAAEALRLARILDHRADVLLFVQPPAA